MAVRRDREAFAAVYLHCGPHILSLLRQREPDIPAVVPSIPEAVIEEVCQEAFAEAWRSSDGFDPERQEPFGWLYAKARDQLLLAVRQHAARMIAADVAHAYRPEPPSVEDEMSQAERTRALTEAYRTLSPLEAELLSDIYGRGLTHTKIAKRRGMPLGTVKSVIRRSIEKMQAAVSAGKAAE